MTRIADLAGQRLSRSPTTAAAIGQFVAGARTITPRLAAKAGVPLIRVLAGTVPAALVWVTGLVTGGALLTAAADTIKSALAVIGPMLLGPPMLLLGLAPIHLLHGVHRTAATSFASLTGAGRAE